MNIPIENIYYLLCYAWNKLEEKDRVKVSIDDKTELLDLFAKVLINATKLLLKRGIDKNYVEITQELPGVKGKIELTQTLKSNLLFKQRAICRFDDFSANSVLNRILISTIQKLIKTKELNKDLKLDLIYLSKMFIDIDPIELSISVFNKIKLNRNNRFYGFIVNVCQIIHENTFPSEEPGKFKFSDFTRDEHKMNKLFESFLRNFYRLEQKKFPVVKGESIIWQFEETDSIGKEFLPQMKTDISLENDSEKIIIDAKYYRETLITNFEKEKIKSNNLYQLFSYLLNQRDGTEKNQKAKGILLYPSIQKEYNLKYRYQGHDIEIRTVNLNENWKKIESRLLEII
jgi:5-methylcytosine-specific restriction enzyme subunit McrC